MADAGGESAVRGGALEASGSGQEQRAGGFPSGARLHPGHPETSPKTGSGVPPLLTPSINAHTKSDL